MTPDDFVLEQWKGYGAYMERKERLIEVATTVYLGFVSALLIRDEVLKHPLFVFLLWLGTATFLWSFVRWQFTLWGDAARFCNSCHTLMTEWLANPFEPKDLTPESREPDFAGVKLPKALWDQMDERAARWREMGFSDTIRAHRFQITVYGLGILWTAAFLVRAYAAACRIVS